MTVLVSMLIVLCAALVGMLLPQENCAPLSAAAAPPVREESLAWVKRDFVDPAAPSVVLFSTRIATHARLTQGRRTWEVGGQGYPVQDVVLRFYEPIRLQNGTLAWSTDDLLARDGEEQHGRDKHE